MTSLFTNLRTPLVTGRSPLMRAPGNLAAPPIVQPPSGLLFDVMSAEGGVKGQFPLSNNQFDAIAGTINGGQTRNWERTLNGPIHRMAGVRYYYSWQNILLGAFQQWQPAWRRVWRVFRKGTTGQALRTLVFECEQNSLTIPLGDKVWFFMSGADYEGQILPDSTHSLNGFSLPMKQKMSVTGGVPSPDYGAISTVEVAFGQDLPAIDYTAPTVQYQSWAAPEPRLWLVHHSFYGNAATKQHRYPYSYHFDILNHEVLANNGHVILGGLQGIPGWRDYTDLLNQLDETLVTELYQMEQQALADTFGNSDPRLLINELENEPTRFWLGSAEQPLGFRESLLSIMYPTARSAWGNERSFLIKGTSFGGLDSLRDEFDLDNAAHFGNGNNFLGNHNYFDQAHFPDNSKIWYEFRSHCDYHAGVIADKVGSLHFKGGGMSEWGVDRFWGEPYRSQAYGRMHTALHARGLFCAFWSYTGDGASISYLYDNVEGTEGVIVEAILPESRPYCGKAGRTV